MKAQTLTKNQKQRALLKEKKRNPVIRNILTSPLEQNVICNRIPDEQCVLIKDCFDRHLKRKTAHSRPKWSDLKSLGKEERKALKRRSGDAEDKAKAKKVAAGMLFGLNSVSRAVEQRTVQLVLLADDVNPPWLVKHVERGCGTHGIPVARVPQLRTLIRNALGFPAIAIAFHHFKDHAAHAIRSVVMRHTIVPRPLHHCSRAITIPEPSLPAQTVTMPSSPPPPPPPPVNTSFYLYRNDKYRRCFVPQTTTVPKSKTVALDFIAFDSTTPLPLADSILYRPLQIKRVKGNLKRKQ